MTPGAAVISGYWPDADDGRATWRHEGSGIYSAPHPESPWAGSYTDDAGTVRFLFRYRNLSDLGSNTLTVSSVIGNATFSQPGYGFCHQGGRVYVRLIDGAGNAINPTGRSIKLTNSFGRQLVTLSRSPHVILEGFAFEGSGNRHAIITDKASHHLTLRNCIFRGCRQIARVQDDLLVEWCEYTYPGFKRWMDDLIRLNPDSISPVFSYVKGDYVDRGNAFLEGGMCDRVNRARPAERALFQFNYIIDLPAGVRATPARLLRAATWWPTGRTCPP